MKKVSFYLLGILLFTLSTSCKKEPVKNVEPKETEKKVVMITEKEVADAQKAWGEGIVKIGNAFTNKEDYKKVAKEHIDKFYNYQNGTVLFKPTLATDIQFRPNFEGALSYFVGSNTNFPEDYGFAIKPWSAVRWENLGTKIEGNMAIAMGNYFFTPAKGGDDVKVEYSFAYTKDNNGDLKIILHGSHLPYNPKK